VTPFPDLKLVGCMKHGISCSPMLMGSRNSGDCGDHGPRIHVSLLGIALGLMLIK